MSTAQATKSLKAREIISRLIKLPNLKSIIQSSDMRILRFALDNRWFRRAVLRILGGMQERFVMKEENTPLAVRKDQVFMGKAMLESVSRLLDGMQDKPIRDALLNRVIPALMKAAERQPEAQAAYRAQYGENPPGFLTISPTKCCNLNCTGCYANAGLAPEETLEFDVVDRIVQEKKELWGSWFTVISGGEPFMYKSQGKTILDLFESHPDNFFLVYTNGQLLNEHTVRRLAELGNVTPAISVEGYEEETDRRRGPGVYRKILKAFENLREHGVPYGVSMTVFRSNAELINEQFFSRYLHELGALFIWVFQYMPIGRQQTLDQLVTPEQRLRMLRDTWAAVKHQKMLVADFWNSGVSAGGCVSAGRPGGYLYIDWNGNITPCVFNPYSPLNIREVYREGKNLNDVVQHPFFKEIRQWMYDYALHRPADETGNYMIPCPIRDHYDFMLPLLRKHQPRAIDPTGDEALKDPSYQEGMLDYGRKLSELMDPIWEAEVIAPEKARSGS